MANIGRVLRQFGATVAAGMVAGGVAGLGARLAMLVVRLLNGSHNGENTHASAIVGRVTVSGTISVVMEGVILGVPAAVLYLLARRWVPGRGSMKGLAFGALLLIVAGSAVLNGDYEYFRTIEPWQAVAMFAALYPLFGVVLGFLAERWAKRDQGPPESRVAAVGGWAVLMFAVVRGTLDGYAHLRDVYHLFPS